MKKKKATRGSDLDRLIHFLNGMPPENNEQFLKPLLGKRALNKWRNYLDMMRQKLKPVLTELRDDAERLLNPPPIPAVSTVSPAEYWLSDIVFKINGMDWYNSYCAARHVMRWPDPLLRDQSRVLNVGGEQFVISMLVEPDAYTREHCYYLLDVTLRSGEFSHVKKCRQCAMFFASSRRDARACSPRCNRDFHNKMSQEKGYFREAYHDRKQRMLKRARKLKAAGESTDRIMTDTGLTEKALIRARIL